MEQYLKKLQKQETFNSDELHEVFSDIIGGESDDLQVAAFLMGLSVRGESPEEIYNLVKILKSKAKKVIVPEGTIDVCGTGGDGLNTLNISTAVAFTVASCGVPVAKHGNKAVSSKSGSSDVLSKLDININASSDKMEQCLSEHNICFLFAPNYHPVLKNIAPIRQSLKVRTIFNLVGPLLNPGDISNQLVGVYNKELMFKYSQVLQYLNYKKAIIVNSHDGLDEISVSNKTDIIEITGKEIKKYTISPNEFDIPAYNLNDIAGQDSQYNANAMIDLFKGKVDAYHYSVAINAAFSLLSSGKYATISEAFKSAKAALISGATLETFNNMKDFLK